MLDINKQKMLYAKSGKRVKTYERDPVTGEIKYYETSDGTKIPLESGETVGYGDPVSFSANISNKLSEALMKEFGVDDSTSYCQIVADKDALPLSAGDVIWRKSSVETTNEGTTDPKSADYIVKGAAEEGLTADLFLLQKIVK